MKMKKKKTQIKFAPVSILYTSAHTLFNQLILTHTKHSEISSAFTWMLVSRLHLGFLNIPLFCLCM